MRAAMITELGGTLSVAEVPTPRPGRGEVLVRVEACGVNFADTLMVTGKYQEKPELPFAPGMEIAGTVEALGEGVAGPAPGTRIAGMAGHGGLADFAVIPAAACVPIPDGMPMDHAAAFLIAYGTSHVGLDYRAHLQPGERLLVLGAAGGVGLTAVEIGKLMGAEVIACARGVKRLEVPREKGADHLLDSEEGNIRDAVRALGGADVVFDPVGGWQFREALRACNPEARLMPLGFASGEIPQIPANILLVKNLTVIGFYWGAYLRFKPKVLTDSFATLMNWYDKGMLEPHVSHRLPLERAEEALDLLRRRKATGKVVVTMG
ncbi:MAG: NADPH:quinone oxidoreductase family protein [Alphaproteobacteria bacterium]|nr:MAG: NADPH:quinone oxidoreductase family protein [Alphaproteobacteria bacterium]